MWTHADMIKIHPKIMCHRLTSDPQAKPIRQKQKALDAYRYRALKNKVDCLLRIGFIRESCYLDWLANPVLVLKPNGKWRICIDFMNVNKACLKISFPYHVGLEIHVHGLCSGQIDYGTTRLLNMSKT